MAGLAGGLGFSGEVCGVLTGAECRLGLYAGKRNTHEEENERLNMMDLRACGMVYCSIWPHVCRVFAAQDILDYLGAPDHSVLPLSSGLMRRSKACRQKTVSIPRRPVITGDVLLSATESTCPECIRKLDPKRVMRGDDVILRSGLWPVAAATARRRAIRFSASGSIQKRPPIQKRRLLPPKRLPLGLRRCQHTCTAPDRSDSAL